jgi:penicillin-binding protein 1A
VFVYLAALESGLSPDSTVLDLPILGSGWSPRNEGAGYRGSVTLRDALALSMNAAAARLNMSVGPRKTAAVAQRLGIRSPLRADASLALGTSEVTLVELTGAYGVLANGGRSVDTHIVRRVRTAAGKVLYERRPEPAQVLVAPEHVAAMNDMLGAVLSSGTGKRAALPGHAAAGKTGTSQDFRDAWFVGYAGEFVAGVWVGNDDGRSMHRVMGGSLPARLWRDIMLAALEGHTPALLSGTARNSIAEAAAGAPPAATGPLLPREPIGADFVERAIADDEPAPEASPVEPQTGTGWVSKAKGLLRELGFGT